MSIKITTIAIDAMGGDVGARVTVPAAINFLKSKSRPEDYRIFLVGQEQVLQPIVSRNGGEDLLTRQILSIYPASEVVGMDEAPALALKRKKDSSMRVAINLVKEDTAQACVSAGNTGALMATARFVLKMIPGIERPAICSSLPTKDPKRPVHMLDLGANVDVSPQMLLQFAIMGSVLTQFVENKQLPTIGLLNVGEEEIKGSEKVKEAAKLLSGSSLNYTGYVEGDEIYRSKVDVVVCDGFEGNVSLKTSEGVSDLVMSTLSEEFARNILTKAAAFLAMPVLKAVKRRLDPRVYNGATLIGLNGTVIKSHGGTDQLGFQHAIKVAAQEVELNLTSRIRQEVSQVLGLSNKD